jgi:MFS family permease
MPPDLTCLTISPKVALTGVFPYLPEMIESFNIPRNEVPKWAGIISAVFSISQAFTAISWGRASDKYGRKPIILLAMTCAMSSSVLFGFSKNLTVCLIARAASGASNGNVGILRTTVAEMVPQRELQPKAFATLPLVWQVGSILGPILGGALASPAVKLPAWFGKNEFLIKFPYALPNLVSSVIFTIGIVIGILFLRESLESRKQERDYGRILGAKLISPCTRNRKDGLRPADDFESNPSHRRKQPTKPPAYRDVFIKQSNLCLLAYFVLALHMIAYDQLLPVFMHLPVHTHDIILPFQFSSGFGMDSGQIGFIFALFGVFSMLAQFSVFPWITTRYGARKCYLACTFVFPFMYLITPYTVLMPTNFTRQLAILLVSAVRAFAGVFAFPCITILMTNSAKSVALLGTLNGVATSLAAVGRAIGPYVAGRVFTWGYDNGYVIAPWWLLAFLAVPGHIIAWWLTESEGFGTSDQDNEMDEVRETIPMNPRRTISQTGLPTEAEFVLADSDSDEEGEDEEDTIAADKPLLRVA